MAEAKPENEIEDDQCPVGKIIHKWVCDKEKECLDKVGGNKERFREDVKKALDKLFNAHKIFKLEEGIQSFKYERTFIQFGYIYKHAMFSARSLSKVMHRSNVLNKLEEKSSITIACLGGGPGSDVLGVLDYFRDFEGQLNIQLYDRKNKWGKCWKSLQAAIDEELHDPRVTVSFHDFDVTTADKNKPDIQDADVITMHYFMEEVYSEREKEEVKECFDHIIQTAKPGALFLYSGMYMYQATDWVHRLLKDNCKVLEPNMDLHIDLPRICQDYITVESIWIYRIQVDLRQEGDLKLFYDIRDNLETGGYPVKEISFRLDGNVVYRLYQKK
ncbi:PREDICTED: uncharacterized protein LOC109464514 [Branchiostoma belcheri]|uniref:Uncharacterized protein LOC109464514 n=1 Tax=Branchiostoma belcheri TaxID=7741 RepID=A0A6P4XKJ7_BRABE|nr:PREDICTED: uncharacterized protein LOC109464514 [Branchiostoma belcheri]